MGAAGLTVRLNPHLRGAWGDLFWLHLDLVVLFGALALPAGLAGAGGVALLRWGRGFQSLRRRVALGGTGVLLLLPLLYLSLLPGVGLGLPWLTDFLSASRSAQVVALGCVIVILGSASLLVVALGEGLARRFGWRWRRRWCACAVGVLLVLAPAAWSLGGRGTGANLPDQGASHPAELPPAPEDPPAPVLLLCIDGADLDDKIEPLVRAGELPTFRRFLEEGTWGPLATLEPTLSPVVWTTLATGRPPAEHGIHQFLYFRLPGMERVIYEFPLHLGLNFRLLPWAEKLPGLSGIRKPYTSNMRRADALWDLVGQRYPVGVYRWLMSWPAEQVPGFSVAAAIGWVDLGGAGEASGAASVYPPDLKLRGRRRGALSPQDLEPFVGEGLAMPRRDPRLPLIRTDLLDPAAEELPKLMADFGTRFTAAGFHPVDPYHHFFNTVEPGEPFAPAIDAAYRLTDRRLGELLAALPPATRVVVVSDHGFDFAANHHTRAPAGVFFGLGPGFAPGRRVEGLSVYDIAPLVLHLLAMPLPEDLPGVRTATYRDALDPAFLADHPPAFIPSYGARAAGSLQELEGENEEEIKDVLRSLGYVQ
jgi:hypothetical protein